ncbi:putative membrane protein [Yersinia rochesterensis]|uniref:Membrane protein n=1 Tax=Yersinia rochesterensis TaxID=1604335 RepID=A0ABM5SSR3_9GAMM|nr:putative membrane protein [Yersinia rochesterensis]AJI88507.1 putative membrane protein [Yersinia frederiksenii Y225]AJJ37591.1 putative membrane protein [Yersinia rochesterensis]CNH41367.1 Uncharacterised protein [Yersinia kristensenii]CRY66787.1 Uncharacterised protein [Yersinia kristensenii]
MSKFVSFSLSLFWFVWLFCLFSLLIVETFPDIMSYIHSIYLGANVSEDTYDSLIALSLWLSFFSAIIAMFFIDVFFKKLKEFS